MSIMFTENYPEIQGSLSFRVTEILYSQRSEFQKIEVVQTPGFGKVLLIDDLVMLTEKDEFIYHEMISHVPLYVHPNPRRILVVGGGDGGTVRECLRHGNVEHIDLVDIDEKVSEACRLHLPEVAGMLTDSRVTCRYEDGVAFVKQSKQRYDVIIIDSTDPISVGEGLFTEAFYRNCYQLLNEDGLLVAQSESPLWQGELVQRINRRLSAIFETVQFYQAHIPTYPSGHWLFSFASKKYLPLADYREDRCRKDNFAFKYYNPALHRGAFALPTFLIEMLAL